ncbi:MULTISPECIES: histidinol phosphate phosphatase domain-containing protein [unclassified Pseudodesulfovibrio]|uniref:histidinol phosphate phosphatase domain-containing protein n=1 Tax=unclassified Pseudodesulfovibrio TaxID=2661612 RepID=UPI000FEC12C5|nr:MULTISPECIES: histidinol phosphate phosphatase domain-containing protein [unclassified Pseudodesulfovibrio]MCJ2163976.1 histidinol phosphate phosphatase domain-containing protein [Pseudodesulfovibrio sp. S3-i]RWU05384.1 histidinol phosphate phosphatase domain-containing protein [Pseudodesulfovibrio sp. S3]
MIDLHTHTVFSDGQLIPAELVRRAEVIGYKAICMTDHADESTMYHVLENVLRFVKKHGYFYDINILAGVELTHVPPALIADMVQSARSSGAQVVVMHGETPVEPVAPGTNLAAIEAGVDILAHPGLITDEEVKLAVEKGVALEITTRGGHSYTNGHVAMMARKHGAKLVVNNDAHAPRDLVSADLRKIIALGAGLTPEEYRRTEANGWEIVQRCMK